MKMLPVAAIACLTSMCGGHALAGFVDTNVVVYPTSGVTYNGMKDGYVTLNNGLACWGPNWKYFSFPGGAVASNDHRYYDQWRTIGGTTVGVRLRHEAWQPSPTQVVAWYEFSVTQDAQFTQIAWTAQTMAPEFNGGTAYAIQANGTTNTRALPIDGLGSLGSDVKRLVLANAADTDSITLDIAPPRTISCDSQARIQLVGNALAANHALTTTITVTIPHAFHFYADETESWVRSDTNGWFAFEVGPQGVPVDVSFLNKDNQGNYIPAGGHGFLTVSNANFYFEDGTRARFWGLNLTAGAALGGQARAAQLAERLARMGINLVRFHHLDSWYNPIIDYNHPDGTTQHLDTNAMANLDAAIYELKQRGIYVDLDPWVQRCFKAADGVDDYGHLGERGNFYLHPYCYLDARMQELIQLTWSQVWSHVNAYTGLAYKDDPAVVLTEVINEGLMQRGPNHVKLEPWVTQFTNWYETWARDHGMPTNQGMSVISANYGEPHLRFYVHVHDTFYSNMVAAFRRIGLRIPINGNNWWAWPWEMIAPANYDFADSHHYYGGDQVGPGSGAGGLWVQHAPRNGGTPFGQIACVAGPGRPVMSSEWGNNPPKTFRSAYPLGLAAVAAFQEWDSFTGYAFSQSTGPRNTLSAYEWESDPASVASMAAGALVFRRADVSPAQTSIAFTFPEGELWTLHWQNGGERNVDNTEGLNVAIEQQKVYVVLSNDVPAGLNVTTTMTTTAAFDYIHPTTEVTSDTGELWRDWQRGVGTINSPRTQAAYGMLGEDGTVLTTANCRFDIDTPFAVVSVSSLDGNAISNSLRLLVTTAARVENTGQVADHALTRVLQAGGAPVICEPVVGALRMELGMNNPALYPVSIDGSYGSAVPLAVSNGVARVELSGEYQTLFYEIRPIPEPLSLLGTGAVVAVLCRYAQRAR